MSVYSFCMLIIAVFAVLFVLVLASAVWIAVCAARSRSVKLPVALLSVCGVLVILMEIYISIYPTYYKYNDSWIIDKTADEIIERYGEFDKCTYEDDGRLDSGYYYIYSEQKTNGNRSETEDIYYIIYFVGDNYAESVTVGDYP